VIKEKIFGIFGLGAFGNEICEEMSKKGAKVIVFEKEKKLIDKIKNSVTQAIIIDTTDEDALKNSPIDNIDVAVVAIGTNMQSSIITTTLLKKYNVPYIIARAISDIHSQLLTQIGANEVINIEIEEGKRLANKLISPNILERIPISKNQTFAEIMVPKSFVGKSLLKLELRNKFNVNVVSIRKFNMTIDDYGNPQKDDLVIFPKPQDVLEDNDILYIVGSDADIEAIKEF